MDGLHWRTTDLCLDVWCGAGGELELLDEDDFTRALDAGWLDTATADRARSVADDLLRRARAGAWPPPEVEEWTLERVREAFAYSSDSSR
jgi:predicted RNA-binding protein associated with RNAse of E/G family